MPTHLLRSTPRRRAAIRTAALLTSAVTAAAVLAGCGGDDKASADASASATPSAVKSAPGDVQKKTKPTQTAVAVPTDGPTGLRTFPVPPGVDVKGPGAQDKSWQFDITTKDVAKVLAFYRKALPAAGFTVRNNVTKNIGAEVTKYDIEFSSGKAHGFIVGDQSQDDVFVVVQSPADLTPSPQPELTEQ